MVHIKVGLTTSLNRRYSEHLRNCPALQPVLLGYFPPSPGDENPNLGVGRIIPGNKLPYIHLVEKLVHLELADVATNAPYLHQLFPQSASGGQRLGVTPQRIPCPSCESTR